MKVKELIASLIQFSDEVEVIACYENDNIKCDYSTIKAIYDVNDVTNNDHKIILIYD